MARILSIGTQVDGLTECVGWNDKENINDYDIVFLNLHSLDTMVGDSSISDVENAGNAALPSSAKVQEHMVAGKFLIVLLPTRRSLIGNTHDTARQGLFDWSPQWLDISSEEGRGIKKESVSGNWEWYFNRPEFNWHLFIESNENNKQGTQYIVDPIIENTYHKAIGGTIRYGNFEIFHGNKINQQWLPGQVMFIPYLSGWAYEDIIKDILYYVFEGATEPRPEDAPEWTNEYTVPSEQDVSKTVESLRSQIGQLESELSDQEDELEEIREIKGLLYGGNDFLERLVPRVFREMGFEVEGEIPGNRDGLINTESHKIILETHGTSGGIGKDKCRQLDDWVSEYQYEHPEPDSFGMLVVNPFNNTPPTERDKPYNNNVLRYVERCGNKVLLTTDLFEMYVRYQNGEIDRSNVETALISNEIVINHPDAGE